MQEAGEPILQLLSSDVLDWLLNVSGVSYLYAMLDFKELPKNGDAFELLIREILLIKGFHVRWSGKGPDGGRDLL